MDQQVSSICNKEEILLRAEYMLQRICDEEACGKLLCGVRNDGVHASAKIVIEGKDTLIVCNSGLWIKTSGYSCAVSVGKAIQHFTAHRVLLGLETLLEETCARLLHDRVGLQEALETNSQDFHLLAKLQEELTN